MNADEKQQVQIAGHEEHEESAKETKGKFCLKIEISNGKASFKAVFHH